MQAAISLSLVIIIAIITIIAIIAIIIIITITIVIITIIIVIAMKTFSVFLKTEPCPMCQWERVIHSCNLWHECKLSVLAAIHQNTGYIGNTQDTDHFAHNDSDLYLKRCSIDIESLVDIGFGGSLVDMSTNILVLAVI